MYAANEALRMARAGGRAPYELRLHRIVESDTIHYSLTFGRGGRVRRNHAPSRAGCACSCACPERTRGKGPQHPQHPSSRSGRGCSCSLFTVHCSPSGG